MPTYDYRCKDCGHEFEIHQSFSEDALTECPVCAGDLRKVFSAVGISFKGSGFYKTDSRGGSSSKTASTSSGGTDSPKSDAGASTSTESSKSDSTSSSTSSSGDSKSSTSSSTASTTSP